MQRPEELADVGGLVIPGGESTVLDKLSRIFGLQEPVRAAIAEGIPVLGTCAGLIMLSNELVDGIEGQQIFGGMDVLTRRNAFGRQIESFEAELEVPELGDAPVRAALSEGRWSSRWGRMPRRSPRRPTGAWWRLSTKSGSLMRETPRCARMSAQHE